MYVIKITAGTPRAKKWCEDFRRSHLAWQKRRVSLDELSKQAQKLIRRGRWKELV